MPRLIRLALVALLGLSPSLGMALEPVSVGATGSVELEPAQAAQGREKALAAALTEAALEVARRFVPPERMAVEEDRIREHLESRAASFVITYRVEESKGPVPSLEDPVKDIYSARVQASVDAAGVREALAELGLAPSGSDRPSVSLQVVPGPGSAVPPPGPLEGFRHFIAERLAAEGLVVLEPALRAGGLEGSPAFMAEARRLGADLGVEVQVDWHPRLEPPHLRGGSAEVRTRAVRVAEGLDLARSRFEAPAYHANPDEAFVRALEAVETQVADNLVLQLGRNWEALAKSDGAVRLRLMEAPGLREVEAVRSALLNRLGAEQADLHSLAPLSAELEVRGPLSPGALQERLVGVSFDGFRLRPVEVSRQLVVIRFEPLEPEAPLAAPDRYSR